MKAKITDLVIISFLLVSCGAGLTTPESEVPAETSVSNIIMTPTPDFTLDAILQGNWLVEIMDADKNWATLGTLAIEGYGYRFYPVIGVEIPSWAQDRFCFFEQPAGEVGFKYEPGVSPNDDIRNFEDHDILLRWAGIGCREIFLIRVDQENQELYLHAQVSEIQLHYIHKSYDN